MRYTESQNISIFVLGPWVIGAFADCLLQGILLTQFSTYFRWYKDDPIGVKLVVVGLVILTCLKTIQACAVVWIQNLYFNDQKAAVNLAYTTWVILIWQSGNPLMVAFIGLYVQAYFLHRLRVISKSWLVVVPIALIIVFAFLAMVLGTVAITKRSGDINMWFAAHLSSVFVGDVLITTAMIHYLLKTKRTVLPQTFGLITALVRLTWSSAAPAAICAMINLALSQAYEGPNNIMSTAFNQALPKLYAVSMMYILNSRQNLRSDLGLSDGINGNSSSHQMSRRTGGFMDPERCLGGITVHTETRNHIDFRNAFDPTALAVKSPNSDAKQGSLEPGN